MRKLIFGAALFALAGSLAVASPAQDRDRRDRDDRHDNGKHKGWDKHGDDDQGDRHDNGRHEGWYKHGDRDDHRDWDYDRDRFRPAILIPTADTSTYAASSSRAESISARAAWSSTTIPIGWLLLMTWTVAAIGLGTATKSMSTTTITTRAGICFSTPGSAATSTSSTLACTR